MNGELHAALDTTDFLIVFPLKDEGRARLIGTVQQDPGQRDDRLSWDDVSQRVIEWLRIEVERVHWFSTYRVHHRVADRFQEGRAFLLGDAAHIHSPVGGQGMNTGIGDAVNLAWKIADVVHGRADSSLLDSYEPERIAFARHLVATTDQAFTGATSDGAIARHVRLNIVPTLAPAVFAFGPTRRLMFRTISQIAIQYRSSRLSEGRAGDVHGGDRLPWVPASGNDPDNFAPLTSLAWQVHVYGDATRRDAVGVRRTGVAPARLSLATRDASGRPAAQRCLSCTTGRVCGVGGCEGQGRGDYRLSRRAQAGIETRRRAKPDIARSGRQSAEWELVMAIRPETGRHVTLSTLCGGDDRPHRRCGCRVLQELVLGTADREYRHRLVVRSRLCEVSPASMTAVTGQRGP